MVLKIRLARFGKRNHPVYNIVLAQAKSGRNSKPLEVLGTYDPLPKPPDWGEGKPYKDVKLDSVRAQYWLGVGAQPSVSARRLLAMLGLIGPKYHVTKMQQAAAKVAAEWQRPHPSPQSSIVRYYESEDKGSGEVSSETT